MLNQRNITTLLFIMVIIGSISFIPIEVINHGINSSAVIAFSAAVFEIGLLAAHLRGWEFASRLLLLSVTVATTTGATEPFVTEQFSGAMFIPPIAALVLATPSWIAATAALVYGIMIARGGGHGVFLQANTLVIYAIGIGGMVLARLLNDRSLKQAAQQSAEAEAALRMVAGPPAGPASRPPEAQSTEQLLELIAELETPALTLAEGVLMVPLVGHIDTRRAQALTERLLQTVAEQRARLVVLDIARVVQVDGEVAQTLIQMAQSIRLLGCEVVLSGVSDTAAATLLQLNLKGIPMVRTPQEALRATPNKPAERVTPPALAALPPRGSMGELPSPGR